MADYRYYVGKRHLEPFDDYATRVADFDAKTGSPGSGESGGARVHSEDQGLWDVSARRAYLDGEGVAAEVIFPQGSAPFAPYPAVAGQASLDYTASSDLRNAGAHIYNRWLADLCSADPGRHCGVALLPVRDIDAAVREVEWARNAGLTGGVSLPPLVDDDFPKYHDRIYERLWAACQQFEMPLNMHGGARRSYGDGPEAICLVLAETDWFSHRGLWFLLFAGVFERYPGLKLAITEQRTHWVAPLLRELDSIYDSARARSVRQQTPKKPSEYFSSNVFVGASFFSRPECAARAAIGVDRIMWGSDYPHIEGTWPLTKESLRWTFEAVPERELRLMLGMNARECYPLDWPLLEDVACSIGPTPDELTAGQAVIPSDPRAEMSWAFRQFGPWN
jgi:predicted TIM-barrel fold metal-dependent hydrolase